MAMPQLLVTAGVCVGYFTCYATIQIQNQWQWRLPFIVQVAGGAILALACLLLPASPRWLLLNDKPQIAMRNLKKLDLTEDELLINSDVPLDNNEGVNSGRPQPQTSLSWRAVSDLFRKEYRFRTTLALFILGMVQLCGIDGVLYVYYPVPCYYHNHSLTTLPVRPDALRTSRPSRFDGIISCIRCLCDTYVPNIYPGFPDSGQVRSPNYGHLGRPASDVLHACYRMLVCLQQRHSWQGSGTLGRHRAHIRLCAGVCVHLGHCWQDLC